MNIFESLNNYVSKLNEEQLTEDQKVISLPEDFYDWAIDDSLHVEVSSGYAYAKLYLTTKYEGDDPVFNDHDINGKIFVTQVECDTDWESGDEPVGGHGDYIRYENYSYLYTTKDWTEFTTGLYDPNTKEFTPCEEYQFYPIINGKEDRSTIFTCTNLQPSKEEKEYIVEKINDQLVDYEDRDY